MIIPEGVILQEQYIRSLQTEGCITEETLLTVTKYCMSIKFSK